MTLFKNESAKSKRSYQQREIFYSKNFVSRWRPLYRVGWVAALIVAVLIPIQIIIFFIWPPPATVIGWFKLFQKSPLVGLLDMDLLLTVDYILLSLLFLALYAALKKTNHSLILIALIFQLIGMSAYFASTAGFEMLTLSNQYAAATTDAQRLIFLAAGQAMLVIWQGTAFNVGYILGAGALIIVSLVMRRSTIFSKPTAYLGLLMGILMIVPPSVGMIGMVISLLSLIPTIPWLILISRKFYQLAHTDNYLIIYE